MAEQPKFFGRITFGLFRCVSGDEMCVSPIAKVDCYRPLGGKDGKHRLNNGSLLTVQGFTQRGHIIVDPGWVIDRDFGHLAHGYCVTSHASQGVTVNKVLTSERATSQ